MDNVIRFTPEEHNPLFSTFFEYMDETSAYVMGYIYAKGVIVQKGKHKAIVIRNSKDLRTLYRIKEILGVKTDISKTGVLTIISDQLCNSLISYGFNAMNHKSKKEAPTSMPFLEEKLMRHFVRGFYDAIGYCTAEVHGRKEDSQRLMTYIPFKNERFMMDFKKHLIASGGPECSAHVYSDRQHTLKFYYNASKSFYWYIYNDSYVYSINKKAQLEHGFGTVYKAKQKYWREKRAQKK